MVRNKITVGMMDWRSAGYIERVDIGLNYFTRAYPFVASVVLKTMMYSYLKSDLDDYIIGANPRSKKGHG
jgi:hypothetical protein